MTSFLGHSFSRRQFVGSVTVGLAASVAPIGSVRAQSAARYTRYNVSCEKGQEMLKSYGIAVKNSHGIEARRSTQLVSQRLHPHA